MIRKLIWLTLTVLTFYEKQKQSGSAINTLLVLLAGYMSDSLQGKN